MGLGLISLRYLTRDVRWPYLPKYLLAEFYHSLDFREDSASMGRRQGMLVRERESKVSKC